MSNVLRTLTLGTLIAIVPGCLAAQEPHPDTDAKPANPASSTPQVRPKAPGAKPPGDIGQGADDKQEVDPQAAKLGKSVYIKECVTCHGGSARGTDTGPDLVRSLIVLHDRYGGTIGPFLKKGHPLQSGAASTSLTGEQLVNLSHFLHQEVNDTLRSGPYNHPLNVLTGDAKAGEAYFNGAGKCNTCHSVTGDLAGIAKRYTPANLQQRFLFPQTASFGRSSGTRKQVTVTVTPLSGPPVTGVLQRLDDFDVSLLTDAGEYKSFKRTPDLKVEKHDPYAAHIELLGEYTDKEIHDMVAYLETLK